MEKAINFRAKANIDKNGNYIVRVNSVEQAAKLSRTKKLLDGTKVKFARHETNSARCLIQHKSITDIPHGTLAMKLKDQGVVKIRSILPD